MNVWVNGCFDGLHIGHIRLLNYAKTLGDYLVVGIDEDGRVEKMKGAGRPIHSQEERYEMLMSLTSVDAVCVFHTDQFLRDLIKALSPVIMVVGSDWEGKDVIGSEYAKEVIYFPRIEGISTTKILDK